MEEIHPKGRMKMPSAVEGQGVTLQVTMDDIICNISQPIPIIICTKFH